MERIIRPILYDSKSCFEAIFKLCDRYDFLNIKIIGKSVNNRPIPCLKIGNCRENVLFCASMHGNEVITTSLLLKFIEDICESLDNCKQLCGINMRAALKSRSLVFVPMSNPDGCDIVLKGEKGCGKNLNFINRICDGDFSKWKANFNGVDINHNFDADWAKMRLTEIENGIYYPSCGKYGGPFPESEPETIAITTLCRLTKPKHIITLHTQGEVIYHGYGKITEREERMAEILSMISGYSLEDPDVLSGSGGFKDWFCKEFSRPGFTIECGLGINPLPAQKITPIYNRLVETFAIAAIL